MEQQEVTIYFIDTSSEFGLDGEVEVETIMGDRNLELAQLPENTIDATKQITAVSVNA